MKMSIALALFAASISMSWATPIDIRHSIHLSVLAPDDPGFQLANLERIANEILSARREGRSSQLAHENPFRKTPQCDYNSVFRTMDGTCNNIHNPWIGAAKTPLHRMTLQKYQDGLSSPRQMYYYTQSILPTARRVSLSVHMTTSNTSTAFSSLLMNLGQFIDHDIALSPESGGEGGEDANKTQCCEASPELYRDSLKECFPISTTNDPIYRRSCIPFLRSAPVPGFPNQPVQRYQMNDLTSYIDASMVYGSTTQRAQALRSYVGGRLRSERDRDGKERLPDAERNPRDCFRGREECRYASGDVRNSEQAALTSVHTLMLRQHNNMVDQLADLNPHWNDEQLYQTGRKILGAIMQRITYDEFLPIVIGPQYMRRYGLSLLERGRFSGYSSSVDTSVMAEFSTAAFRFGHSLIRQTFSHSGHGIDLKDIFDSYKTTSRYGSDGLLKGMIQDRIEACDQFVTRGVRDNLFGEEMDLPSFNIQRGRDHGLASYNDVRRAFRMSTSSNWDGMAGHSHSHRTVNDMQTVYPHPEDIELFPGGMAETPLPGALVGETFANIIADQFRRLRYGDRYWHETTDTRRGFTDAQLTAIRRVTLASLYCENIPGIRIRKNLLRVESYDNPATDCSQIEVLDLTPWQEATPRNSEPSRSRSYPAPRPPTYPSPRTQPKPAAYPPTQRSYYQPRYQGSDTPRPSRPPTARPRNTARPFRYSPRRPRYYRNPQSYPRFY